jgi:hypothetical protein
MLIWFCAQRSPSIAAVRTPPYRISRTAPLSCDLAAGDALHDAAGCTAAGDAAIRPWPSVGLFLVLTDCGWNWSSTEALMSGVPMMAVPQWTDRPVNTWYVEAACRAGVRVQPEAASSQTGRRRPSRPLALALELPRLSPSSLPEPRCSSPSCETLEFSRATAAICGCSNPVHRFSRSGSGYGRPQGIIWGQSMRCVALLGKFQINR